MMNFNFNLEQAELCQSQEKLELATPALPSTKLWSSSCLTLRSFSIYQNIWVVFYLPRNLCRLPFCQEIVVFFHLEKKEIVFRLP